MNKFFNLLKYEVKTITKDITNLFLLFYPFLMLFMMGFVIPRVLDKTADNNGKIIVLQLVVGLALSLGAYVSGAILAFSIIENKDDNTILNISVTPLSLKGYLIFKISYSFLFSLFSNMIIIGGLKLFASDKFIITINEQTIGLLNNLTWLKIIVFSIVMSMFVPVCALLIASFSKNKIEGFTIMKSGGVLVLLPLLTLLDFFQGAKQYLLGVLPNFWPIKAMLNISMQNNDSANLNYYIYMLIGIVFLMAISILTFRLFIKKNQ